jgi:hypothetical protein
MGTTFPPSIVATQGHFNSRSAIAGVPSAETTEVIPVRVTADGRGLARVSKTNVAIINGDEDLSTWDDEELERGIRRGPDGRFRRPPILVARAVHDELVKRRMSKAYDLLRESTYEAVVVLREVALDKEADAKVRVEAASTILDRVLGKAPQAVALEVSGDPAWAKLMASAIISANDMDRAQDIIDVTPLPRARPIGAPSRTVQETATPPHDRSRIPRSASHEPRIAARSSRLTSPRGPYGFRGPGALPGRFRMGGHRSGHGIGPGRCAEDRTGAPVERSPRLLRVTSLPSIPIVNLLDYMAGKRGAMAKHADRLKRSLDKAHRLQGSAQRSYLKAEQRLSNLEALEARERDRDAALQSELAARTRT